MQAHLLWLFVSFKPTFPIHFFFQDRSLHKARYHTQRGVVRYKEEFNFTIFPDISDFSETTRIQLTPIFVSRNFNASSFADILPFSPWSPVSSVGSYSENLEGTRDGESRKKGPAGIVTS